MSKPGQPEYILEYERLVKAHGVAIRSEDAQAITHTQHELELFIRYMSQGRIQEYFEKEKR